VKLYCLSGLGVDKRAFQNIKPKGVELIHIDWIEPLLKETLEEYSKRLFDRVQPEDGYSLIGVSFGGMISAEFSKNKQPNKLFLVSTINNRKELSGLFKIGSALCLHKLIPIGLMRRANAITNYFFSVKDVLDKKLLSEILYDTDPKFMKWAINAVVKWRNNGKPNGIKIHGTKDRMLPLNSESQYRIKGGGHFMIVNRGFEISRILEKEAVSVIK